MIDVVVTEIATGEEVERIPCNGEREALNVLSGIRINMSPLYRANTYGHDHWKSGCTARSCTAKMSANPTYEEISS